MQTNRLSNAVKAGPAKNLVGVKTGAMAPDATYYWTNWSQKDRGFYYINWEEEHNGQFSWAWWSSGTGTSLLRINYHHCGLSSGIGYSVDNIYCTKYYTHPYTHWYITNYDQYLVSVIAKGVPIHGTHWMKAIAKGNGTLSWAWG